VCSGNRGLLRGVLTDLAGDGVAVVRGMRCMEVGGPWGLADGLSEAVVLAAQRVFSPSG